MIDSNEKLLMHVCCAPCLIYPIQRVSGNKKFSQITGYFFNPNIYPDSEYDLRLKTVQNYSSDNNINMIYNHDYNRDDFCKTNLGLKDESNKRCEYCYRLRIQSTAQYACKNKYTHFSTTLLFSIYQKHDIIISIAKEEEEKTGVAFYYEDFRPGWKHAVEYSRKIGMYRQKYCGCITSCTKKRKN
ncbi:epoxyqueuosine reductase QueH [Candidatus Poribacteria bacterium]|nr:epoxyqueuosine reductase QueH [Candidatus Poribacteria bacterium]